MFLNTGHFLNTPTHKFVLFPVYEFSLEVFNSSVTLLSTTTKSEKPLFLLLFKTRNFPRLRLSQSGTSNFALKSELRKNALIISQSHLSNFSLYMTIGSMINSLGRLPRGANHSLRRAENLENLESLNRKKWHFHILPYLFR
jgi:hypothetical protein